VPVIDGFTYPDEPPGLGEAIAKELMGTAYCFNRRGRNRSNYRLIFRPVGAKGVMAHEGWFCCNSQFAAGHRLIRKWIWFTGRHVMMREITSWARVLALHRPDGTVVWEVPDYEKQIVKLALLSI